MLVCRACNTRYEKGTRACPSCGRKSASNASDSSSGESGRLPPSRRAKPRLSPEVDLELTESSVLDDSASGSVPSPRRKKTRKPAPKPQPQSQAAPSQLEPDTEQVRMLLAEQPSMLETGLLLYADDDGDGVDFTTPVGAIDLLCRDRKGGFVAVLLPAPDEIDDSVSAMLRRMGWVRKHLADDGDEVRGIVVLEQLPEELAYAAAGAAGAIVFKGFKLALTFHDLDA